MRQLINDGWVFTKMPNGSTYDETQSAGRWQPVDLPHDWLIWQTDDLYESADAWYRRILDFSGFIPKSCLIRFDGVYMDCEILLNGERIAEHRYGYTAFTVDLTGRIRTGENELAVHIRHKSPNSRWYSGSGIFRDVYLYTLPENYTVPYSMYLAAAQADNGEWMVRVSLETRGRDGLPVYFRVTDAEGRVAAMSESFSASGKASSEFRIPQGKAWSVSCPYLYTLQYTYENETTVCKFGLRSVMMDPDRGLFLNGEHIKLKGVCLHHDLGCLGSAFHEKAARRQLQLMKEMGANAVRTSHNPPAEKVLDLCDEMGMLVVDEAFDMWERPKTEYDYARFFQEYEAEDVASWIRRDRNHPSVIMWSIGNEIYDMHADIRGTEITKMLAEQVHMHDPEHNGAVTFGCNYMPWEGGQRCADVVKVAGYNYGEKLYAAHHASHPDWIIYGSETASVLSSRGVYHFPIEKSIMSEADLQCSALGNSNTSWGAENLRKMIVDDLQCDYSLGQFIWSGIDYIGEPTPYHTRSCYFGQADTACFPKDPYYLFQSMWSDNPVLHIGVTWDWNPGQMIDVPVMTNCAAAELFVNGRSAGIRYVDRRDAEKCLPVWKIPYEPGEIRAAGYDQHGLTVMEDRRYTPGNTSRIVLTAEDRCILGDGYDITFITACAYDADGHPVDNARDRMIINVSGGGCLLGTDNGDSTDPDGYKCSCRRLFNGKLLLLVGSDGGSEPVCIRTETNEGLVSEITIGIIPAEIKPGYSRKQRIRNSTMAGWVSPRKIEILPREERKLTAEHPSCVFDWRIQPPTAQSGRVQWQITNSAGIVAPFAEVQEETAGNVRVTAAGDGDYYLRAMTGDSPEHPDIISQIEISCEGIGNPPLNPYDYVSAGLYDIHEGEIGTGNEKGIAFSREGESMVGFSRVDFGKSGSDTMILPIFALNGETYEIELFDGDPREGGTLIDILKYRKPSIWNVYQEETFRLPVRLTGMRTLCFRMHDKVHMKAFRFEKQSRAYTWNPAGSADELYGDSFERSGETIRKIGNNVSLVFHEMDFGPERKAVLRISGATPHEVNTVTVRISGENGETVTSVADFARGGGKTQEFRVDVPSGLCTVTFVFLPGSLFDFDGFMFSRI